jgi:hypothetical protein
MNVDAMTRLIHQCSTERFVAGWDHAAEIVRLLHGVTLDDNGLVAEMRAELAALTTESVP